MKKFIFCTTLLCASMNVHAKVIIMGSHGGADAYNAFGLMGTDKGYNYDPLRAFVQSPEQVLASSSAMPAVPLELQDEVDVVSRISGDTSDTEDMVDWFLEKSGYQPGDKIILIGYSAGGKFVVNLAKALSGYTFDGMFLIDPFVDGKSNKIPINVSRVAVYHQKTWHELITSKFLVGFRSYHNQGSVTYFPNHPAKMCGLHHKNIDNSYVVYDDVLAKIRGLINGSIHSSNIGNDDCYRKVDEVERAGGFVNWFFGGIKWLISTPSAWALGPENANLSDSEIRDLKVDVTIHDTTNLVQIEFADNPGEVFDWVTQTLPEPVSGRKPDHTPDYDVFSHASLSDQYEISANHDDEDPKRVSVGQKIWHRLETETDNRDVSTSDLRDDDSESIEGYIECRVVGHTQWQGLPGAEDELEYDVKNLKKGEEPDEIITSIIPNYPGSVLECRAEVDGDDEVDEKSESNNRSRVERFFIAEKLVVAPKTSGVSLVRKPSVIVGHSYGLGAYAYNTGDDVPVTSYRMDYQIYEGSTWRTIGGDALKPSEMRPGAKAVWHEMSEDSEKSSSMPGTYKIRACIRNVSESCSEGVMQVVPKPKPDLYIHGAHLTRTALHLGDRFTVKVDVRNKGQGRSAPSVLHYHSAKNGGSWKHIGSDHVEALNTGERNGEDLKDFKVSGTSGSYRVRVCADQTHTNTESDESNNCKYMGYTIVDKPKRPTGHLDRANCSVLEGWAKDPNSDKSLSMHIYRDGKHYATTTANRYRKNLPFTSKRHGYRYLIPNASKDGKKHTWRVYAIDDRIGGYAGNPRIGSDKAFTCQNPHAKPIRWNTHASKCLDVSGGDSHNGNNIQMWDCGNGRHPNMQFIFPQGNRGPIRWAKRPDLCLDVSGGRTSNGTNLQIWSCGNGKHPNMQFIIPNGRGPLRWATHPHLCLDVSGGRTSNGTNVQLWYCGSGKHPNMQFRH